VPTRGLPGTAQAVATRATPSQRCHWTRTCPPLDYGPLGWPAAPCLAWFWSPHPG